MRQSTRRSGCAEDAPPGVVNLEQLPALHKDPFDRLLVAQSLETSCTLVTPDPLIAQYGVPVCW